MYVPHDYREGHITDDMRCVCLGMRRNPDLRRYSSLEINVYCRAVEIQMTCSRQTEEGREKPNVTRIALEKTSLLMFIVQHVKVS